DAALLKIAEESIVHLNAHSVSAKEAESQLLVQSRFSRDVPIAGFLCMRAAPTPIGGGEDHIRSSHCDARKDLRLPVCVKRGRCTVAARTGGFTNFHASHMHDLMRDDKLDQPDFGVALQRARKRLGLSQRAVAAKVGLEQCTVSRIEKGIVRQSSKADELR